MWYFDPLLAGSAQQQSGSAVAVTAGVGAMVATGFAPSVATPRNVSPAVGEAVFTGFAPVWSTAATGSSFSGTPGLGEAVFAGLAPSVQTPRNVTAGVGAAIFAGFAPTIQTPQNVSPSLGEAVWAGLAPTWASAPVGASFEAFPGVGAATFAGFAPDVVVAERVFPGGGGGPSGRLGGRKKRKREPVTALERAIVAGHLSPERQSAFLAQEAAALAAQQQEYAHLMGVLAVAALDFLEDA